MGRTSRRKRRVPRSIAIPKEERVPRLCLVVHKSLRFAIRLPDFAASLMYRITLPTALHPPLRRRAVWLVTHSPRPRIPHRRILHPPAPQLQRRMPQIVRKPPRNPLARKPLKEFMSKEQRQRELFQ